MDCRTFERQLQLNIDGLLSAEAREEMLQHAQACPSCAALMQDMTDLHALLSRRLCAAEPPAGFAQAVMAALPELPARQAARTKVKRPVWQRWGAVAAAAVLLLAGGLYGLWPNGDGVQPEITVPGPGVVAGVPNPGPESGPDVTPPVQLPPQTPPKTDDPLPLDSADDDTEDPQAVDTPPTTDDPQGNPTVTLPPVIVAQDPQDNTEPYVGSLDLPRPALESAEVPQDDSVFLLTVLAAYEECDAVLPSLNKEGQVEFYTKYKNKTQLWTQTLGAEEGPQYQDNVTALPALTEITGSLDESAPDLSKVSAVSPDGRFIAVNRGGEQPGVWLYANTAAAETAEAAEAPPAEPLVEISALGGGKILCWSADSNKLLYTDSSGKLYVYYNFLKKVDVLYSGAVSCASWAADSKTVVFSGKTAKNAHSAVYSIIVP
jgi:hypothetical protein